MEGRGFGFVTFTDAAHAQSFLEVGLNNNLDHVAKPVLSYQIRVRHQQLYLVCLAQQSLVE